MDVTFIHVIQVSKLALLIGQTVFKIKESGLQWRGRIFIILILFAQFNWQIKSAQNLLISKY